MTELAISTTSSNQSPEIKNLQSNSPQRTSTPTAPSSPSKAGSGHRNFKVKSKHKQRRKGQRTQKQSQKSTTSVPRRGPVFLYVSSCCSLPARKPIAAVKVFTLNPDSGKSKETPKGLGKWRCTGCNKRCIVTRTKTEVKNETNTIVEQPSTGISG